MEEKKKLAAEIVQLKPEADLEKEKKKMKESSSGEAANPKKQWHKLSNASTRRKQVPILTFNYFSGCHFFDGLSVHRQSLMLRVTLRVVPIFSWQLFRQTNLSCRDFRV